MNNEIEPAVHFDRMNKVVEELLMGGFCQLIRTVEDLDQRCPKARHNPGART